MPLAAGVGVNLRYLRQSSGLAKILQPIALTNAEGIVFVTALGAVLVRGTQKVTPIPKLSAFRNGVWHDDGYWDDAKNWQD